MKKFITILLLIAMLSLYGCKNTSNYSGSISQLRQDILFGESKVFSVYAYLETRENPFSLDGVVGELEKAIIFKLHADLESSSEISISFTTDKEYETTLSFDARHDGYVCTQTVDKLPEKQLCIYISLGDTSETITLSSLKQSGIIDHTKAIDAVMSDSADLIASLQEDKVSYEISARLLYENGANYWYVGIITSQKTYAYLIDASTKKIIAKKEISKHAR